MADEPEKKEGSGEEPPAQKKGLPVKWIVLGLVVLALLGGGLFAWKKGLVGGAAGGEAKENASGAKAKKQPPDGIGPIYPLEAFIVNLNEPLGKRYLKAKIELEMDSEAVRAEIDRRLPQFRDAILSMMSSKTFQEVSDLSGKFQLRAEIISALNSYLKTGKIGNLYFTEFIIQ
jgi:flagellar FliL protein